MADSITPWSPAPPADERPRNGAADQAAGQQVEEQPHDVEAGLRQPPGEVSIPRQVFNLVAHVL